MAACLFRRQAKLSRWRGGKRTIAGRQNFGFVRIEGPPGNVGYVDLLGCIALAIAGEPRFLHGLTTGTLLVDNPRSLRTALPTTTTS